MNRLAWGIACLAFLLIGSGGLVTASSAGMAIPDWPTTFGHWLYPPQRWLGQFGDVAVHQGHRTLAQLTALGAIGLAAGLWRWDPRRRMHWLGLGVAASVVAPSLFGGWRVVGGSELAGWSHAAMAPVLLGLCAAVVAATSRPWLSKEPAREHRHATAVRRWCLGSLLVVSLLSLAAIRLRDVPAHAGLLRLPFWAWATALLAVAGALATGRLVLLTWRHFGDRPMLVHRSRWLAGLLAAQVLAGVGQWVSNYGWPPWFTDYVYSVPYTVVAEGPLQVTATTLHVALGALVPAVGIDMALWAHRLVQEPRE